MKLSLKEDALARRLAAFSRFQPAPEPWPGRGCSGPRLLTRTSGGRGERATSAPARKSASPGHPDTGRGPLRPGVQSVGGARSARRVQGHSAKTWLRGALSAAWHGHRSPHGGRSWWRAEPAGAGCPLPVSGSCGCVLWLSTQPGRDLASGADVPPRTGHTCSPRLARPPAVPGLSWLEVEVGHPKVTYTRRPDSAAQTNFTVCSASNQPRSSKPEYTGVRPGEAAGPRAESLFCLLSL